MKFFMSVGQLNFDDQLNKFVKEMQALSLHLIFVVGKCFGLMSTLYR